MSRTCNCGKIKKYIGAHKSKTTQFASAIDNNFTSAFLGRNISKLPTRQITVLSAGEVSSIFSKLPIRQITKQYSVCLYGIFSKLPIRQITVRKHTAIQHTY